jgi:hypothetical protein
MAQETATVSRCGYMSPWLRRRIAAEMRIRTDHPESICNSPFAKSTLADASERCQQANDQSTTVRHKAADAGRGGGSGPPRRPSRTRAQARRRPLSTAGVSENHCPIHLSWGYVGEPQSPADPAQPDRRPPVPAPEQRPCSLRCWARELGERGSLNGLLTLSRPTAGAPNAARRHQEGGQGEQRHPAGVVQGGPGRRAQHLRRPRDGARNRSDLVRREPATARTAQGTR